MLDVKVLADSTCDLPKELIELYDVGIIPLYAVLGEESFKDGIEIQPQEVFDYSDRTKTTPKSSAPSVVDYCEAFKPFVEQGRDLIYIGISSEFSSSVQNAHIAAKEFGDAKIRIVDSQSLSSGIGLQVLKAAEMAKAGESLDCIVAAVESMIPRIRASFIIDTTTYLYRGGRCSALQAVGASAFQIKPQIVIEDGKMHPGAKYRGNIVKSAVKYAEAALQDIQAIDPQRIFITYSLSDSELVSKVDDVVRSKGCFGEIIHSNAGCVISSHCGPNTIGILYVVK